MLDQMFTAENFRRIFDVENRKGNDLAARFFPNTATLTLAIKDKASEIRILRSKQHSFSISAFKNRITILKSELKDLKDKKSTEVDLELQRVASNIKKSGFRIEMSRKDGFGPKPVYVLKDTPENFFLSKQLQLNIKAVYKVSPANRHDVSNRVAQCLLDGFPYEIVRTDISSFYENVDRERLLNKINRDHLLSATSKKFVRQILDDYGRISESKNGIPRGIGISAYLAEVYLREIDRAILRLPGLVLYCRYVDDIVAFFARPPSGAAPPSYKDAVLAAIGDEGLPVNTRKTKEIILANGRNEKFEYLGYRFLLTPSGVKISLSAKKIYKYKTRLDLSFAEYHKTTKFNSRRAYRELVGRIRFLTRNTSLVNSKSNARVGIYYNNPLCDNLTGLKLLDDRLRRKIKETKRSSLQKRLRKESFVKGFEERRFANFGMKQLVRVVGAWKHA